MNTERKVVTDDPSEALKIMAEIYQSRFIGIKDLKEAGKAVMMKIRNVSVEELSSIMLDGRKIEGGERGIIEFDRPVGKKNELILNKTSFRTLRAAWGDDPKRWVGAKVNIVLGKVNGKEASLVTPADPAVADHAKKQGKLLPAAAEPKPADTVNTGSGAGVPRQSGGEKTPPDLSFDEDSIPPEGDR